MMMEQVKREKNDIEIDELVNWIEFPANKQSKNRLAKYYYYYYIQLMRINSFINDDDYSLKWTNLFEYSNNNNQNVYD
jgi:hypothetical protein